MTLEEIKEAVEVIKAYRQMLTDSVSNQLDEDIKAFDIAIEAIEREPCEDCISRQAVIDAFGLSEKTRKYGGDHSGYDTMMKYEIQDVIENLPPVNPQKIGHWIVEVWNNREHHSCSVCQRVVDYEPCYHYCPYCGAELIYPQESEGKDG